MAVNNTTYEECQEIFKKMAEKDHRIKSLVDSGDCFRSSILVSMGYLLISIADEYIQDALDILDKHGLHSHDIKYVTSTYCKSFSLLHQTLKARNVVREYEESFCGDYDRFKAVCDTYMNMSPGDCEKGVELKIKES